MIKVENSMQCYEVNGERSKGLTYPNLIIRSHWNESDRVIIELPDGTSYTVLYKDILAAISNATNIARF